MANKMLIDATHPEETRVVVVRGNRVEEFDFESANRRPLRGNIYLAKVTRVEPSLQAAFVDYGGNRHGFLAFGEIHPDYYQIPVADRQRLIEEEQRAAEEADQRRKRRHAAKSAGGAESISDDADHADDADHHDDDHDDAHSGEYHDGEQPSDNGAASAHEQEPVQAASSGEHEASPEEPHVENGGEHAYSEHSDNEAGEPDSSHIEESPADDTPVPEVVESVASADAMEEVPERAPRRHRTYKIQEVIKRRQIILVQVVKEERGTKGAALTTYLSLAGRYSVLMPNTARGGGISRKITDGADRRRLKDLVSDLDVPEGMGVILRTAGASRTKT